MKGRTYEYLCCLRIYRTYRQTDCSRVIGTRAHSPHREPAYQHGDRSYPKRSKTFCRRFNQPVISCHVFDGAEALYTLIPFDPTAPDYTEMQLQHVHSIAQALRGSTIKYAVTLSSVGAHLPAGAGVVQGLHSMEELFNEIPGINILHLRATYFLENTLSMAAMVKQMGIIGSPVRADLKVPMVATKDIAAAALKHLLAKDFSGKNHEYILGNREYTYAEIAQIYGRTIGKPDLKYVQFPYADAKKAMMQMGMGESVVDKMNEFVKSMNEGKILEDVHRTPANTTPTPAEEFAQIFKSVYEKS